MVKLVVGAVLGLICAQVSGLSWGQGLVQVTDLMDGLRSDSVERRTLAARDVYGSGIESPELYELIAQIIRDGVVGLEKRSPRVEELSWHAKALGCSGDLRFQPLLEELTRSSVRKLVRHSESALAILDRAAAAGRPCSEARNVMLLTERQVETCQFVTQQNCSTSRGSERCVHFHKERAVEFGANAMFFLHHSSNTDAFNLFGGEDANIIANYYFCKRG